MFVQFCHGLNLHKKESIKKMFKSLNKLEVLLLVITFSIK